MSASSRMPKDAWDHIPYCKDQGIKNLAGAVGRGVSILNWQEAMPVGGVISLPYEMADTAYQVFIHNHTGAVQGTVDTSGRTVSQFTVVGPTAADVLDIMVVGKASGQLA